MSVIISRGLALCLVARSLPSVVIQQKRQRPGGFWKLADPENDTPQYSRPFASPDVVQETRTITTAIHSPKVPTVRTTLPSEDFQEQKKGISPLSKNTKPSADASVIIDNRQTPLRVAQIKQNRQQTHDSFASALRARKFHLVKSPLPISSPILVPKTFAQRHRRSRRKNLAVFVERTEIIRRVKKPGNISRPSNGDRTYVNNGERNISQIEKPHKRPNATAAERKWRTENWANHPKPNEANENLTRTAENINEPSSEWNYESTQLTEQLQRVALEEIRASEEDAKVVSDGGILKVKPKPPKLRQPRIEKLADDDSGDEILTDTINFDDDDDYVLDTYVRSRAQPFGITEPAESHQDPLQGTCHGNIGILVLEDDEEEALWEAFAEGQESDAELNSEEEDENGLWTDS